MIDSRARRILFDRFWSPGGWKPGEEQTTAPEDFAYAKTKGLMFDEAPRVSHDERVAEVCCAVAGVSRSDVAGAFLGTLSTRRLDLRSALGSWAIGRWLAPHPFDPWSKACGICGAYNPDTRDRNILSFERHKWGGVRHDKPEYIAFDLSEFARTVRPDPTADDRKIFRAVLDAAASSRPDGTQADLKRSVGKILPSNEAERGVVLKILAYCGVLESHEHPGFARIGMTTRERNDALRLTGRSDIDYPLCWWRGRDGVNAEHVRFVFGDVL